MLRVRYLVAEKSNRCQIRFDRTRRQLFFLHIIHIVFKMLWTDIRQFLQPVFIRQVTAKPLHYLVIPCSRFERALPVVPCHPIQLGDEIFENACIFYHLKTPSLNIILGIRPAPTGYSERVLPNSVAELLKCRRALAICQGRCFSFSCLFLVVIRRKAFGSESDELRCDYFIGNKKSAEKTSNALWPIGHDYNCGSYCPYDSFCGLWVESQNKKAHRHKTALDSVKTRILWMLIAYRETVVTQSQENLSSSLRFVINIILCFFEKCNRFL